jgi:hypothetical protein
MHSLKISSSLVVVALSSLPPSLPTYLKAVPKVNVDNAARHAIKHQVGRVPIAQAWREGGKERTRVRNLD